MRYLNANAFLFYQFHVHVFVIYFDKILRIDINIYDFKIKIR